MRVPVEPEPNQHLDCQPLGQAAIHWGDPALVAELKQMQERGEEVLTALFPPQTEVDRLSDPYCRILDILRQSLIEKLKAEELIAVAFTETSTPDTDRIRIHPGRWRILTPNFSENTAQGGGLKLHDVLVITPYHPFLTGSAISVSAAIPPGPATDRWVLSVAEKSLRRGSEKRHLSDRPFQLLRFLVERLKMGRPVAPAREIHKGIFSHDTADNTVRSVVSDLRADLDGIGALRGLELIQTRNRQGYMLGLDASEIDIE